ncbi:MAG: DUF2608 domain-containing protein [Alphaproteobacteria bacterium]|nr:DUF2608 domain-containing protein [Alphaproteobacteria bacterium]
MNSVSREMLIRLISATFMVLCLFGCEFARENRNHQEIIRTDDLETIKSVCDEADSQTLVIFDMDNVLTEPTERAFQADLYPKIGKIVDQYREQVKKMSPPDQEKLKGAQWEIPVCLVDESMPLLIRSLQDRGIKVLMLTANPHGRIANIDSIENLCDARLLALGIDFGKSWHSVNVKRRFDTDLTIFYKGEVFTLESKEIALKRFLEHIPEQKFQKIIFVDDKRKNLEKVKNLAEKLEMDFFGIEYFRVFTKNRPKTDFSLMKERFEQLKKVVSSKTKSL